MDLGKTIPATIKDGVDVLVASLSPEDVEFISKNFDPGIAHFSAGMCIRNVWGLWGDNSLVKDGLSSYGLWHADDLSGLILAWVFARSRGDEFNPQEHAEIYKKFWKDREIDGKEESRD